MSWLSFKDRPIGYKLSLMIMATAGLVLLLASTIFFINEIITYRRAMVQEISAVARVIGSNSTAALSFDDANAAEMTLYSLKSNPIIHSAFIFNRDGQVFSHYESDHLSALTFTERQELEERARQFYQEPETLTHFWSGRLHVLHKIILDNDVMGVLYVQATQNQIVKNSQTYLALVIVIASLLLLLAYFMAKVLQQIISKPIVDLSQAMQEVSELRDFSIRVLPQSNDEIGMLSEGFNDMLRQIEKRDLELTEHREHLAELVDQRTRELSDANKTLEITIDHLQKAKEAAEAANRIKTQFLANMSHELRTPLNAIIGYSEMISEDLHDSGHTDVLEDVHKISASGKHLLALISSIMDISKLEAGAMEIYQEDFDIRQLIEDAVVMVTSQIEKNNNRLECRLAPHLGRMYSDSAKIRQSLVHVLNNAAKFTQQGTVSLEVDRQPTAQGGEVLILKVTDTGIGIDKEHLANLFQPFMQADLSSTRQYGGTGLGLSLTKSFCEMLGGDIQVESVVGRGSTFTITLPIMPAD